MKKAIALLLGITLLVTLLAACGNTQNQGGSADAQPSETSTPSSTAPSDSATTSDDHSDWIQLNLTYGSFLPSGHASEEQLRLFEEKCNERMDGLVDITIYSAGSMVSMTDTYDGVANGVVDMGFLMNSTCTGVLNLALLCDQPGFYYESGTAAAMAMNDYLKWVEENSNEFDEVIVLSTLGLAPQAIQLNKEVNSLDDLRGLTVYGAASYAEGMQAWGMVPSIMDFSEIYEATRNGLLDACIQSVGSAANALFQEVCDYSYLCHVVGQANCIVMNRDVFEQMPESQQQLFRELWQEVQEEYVNYYLEDFTYGNDTLSQEYCRDVKYFEVLPEEMEQEMYDLVKDLPDQYAQQCDAMGLPGTEALAYYREVLDKYNEMYPGDISVYTQWRE